MSIKFGGDKRDRTADLRSASASLSQTELYPQMKWSGKRGSNSRHSAWKADALPTELFPHRSSQGL